MRLDYETLVSLRKHHPAWRLLRSDHAELIASFLFKAFIVPNLRVIPAFDLSEALEDHLFILRQQGGETLFPKTAADYLNDWAEPDKGWLRKFYRPGTDEPQFDLTPATEKAIAWFDQLSERTFVGTESRLLTLVDLLRQMSDGSEIDPTKRLMELERRKADIDGEIARINSGELPMLDDTAIRDRFQQFSQIARDLLADFREVEYNFRQLDRRVREKIALWEGSKGDLIEDIMGQRDAIGDSDQGRSFRAFWDFLLSGTRQEELSRLLETVLGLSAVASLQPDPRMRRIHHDWLEAGEHTQRTVAQLSQQLRRFLDDQAFLENRRIMEILRALESKALEFRDVKCPQVMMDMDEVSVQVELPMERPLHVPSLKTRIEMEHIEVGQAQCDAGLLFEQVRIDRGRLKRHLLKMLQTRQQVSMRELVETQPLEQGLTELVAYLQLGMESFTLLQDDTVIETIEWSAWSSEGERVLKVARMPRMIFIK
ncbi:MAG: DUF3375 domain-containing protein [Methylococcus sp.]